MFNMILQTLFGFIVIQGICSKSIQNVTIEDSKVVTTDMLENWKKNMTDWITELFERSQKDNDHVFFYAKIKTDIILNKNSVVKFSDVLNNEGNHFNSGDSVFVSPVSGVYLFSWATMTFSGKNVNTELRVNNVVKETLHVNIGSSVGRLSVSKVIICNVQKNDHVWIQTSHHYAENYLRYNFDSGSSFMGFLMYVT